MIGSLPLLFLPSVFQTFNRLLVSCAMFFKFPKSWLMKPCTLVLLGSRLSRLNAGEIEDGEPPLMSYQYKREPLTPDEANRLASACETHQERLIVWTLLDTGLRVSELAGLTREHIDWQNRRLMIYGKGGIYGTKSKRRIIPLTDRIRPLIDGHFAIHDTIGMTPRTIQRILKRLANKAHINRPVTPHVLRHTFAVTAVQKGISLPALQRLLGHDRLTTTEIYLNLSPEDVIREFKEKW
jgi:integrase/recombinase XerD